MAIGFTKIYYFIMEIAKVSFIMAKYKGEALNKVVKIEAVMVVKMGIFNFLMKNSKILCMKKKLKLSQFYVKFEKKFSERMARIYMKYSIKSILIKTDGLIFKNGNKR